MFYVVCTWSDACQLERHHNHSWYDMIKDYIFIEKKILCAIKNDLDLRCRKDALIFALWNVIRAYFHIASNLSMPTYRGCTNHCCVVLPQILKILEPPQIQTYLSTRIKFKSEGH